MDRHSKFWFEDGNIVFCASNTLFCVHCGVLVHHSPALEAILAIPLGYDTDGTEQHPIVLYQILKVDFIYFLNWVDHISLVPPPPEEQLLVAILKIAPAICEIIPLSLANTTDTEAAQMGFKTLQSHKKQNAACSQKRSITKALGLHATPLTAQSLAETEMVKVVTHDRSDATAFKKGTLLVDHGNEDLVDNESIIFINSEAEWAPSERYMSQHYEAPIHTDQLYAPYMMNWVTLIILRIQICASFRVT
ncbi:hypothetical protein EDD22DRAFT_849609 [Suillus occidentalis]|nr:hypothetical protein EDD22DRAFT_849609 [Suillus occidentalis]